MLNNTDHIPYTQYIYIVALPYSISGQTDREAAADAIYRACLGIDTNDKELFNTAFTQDATFQIAGRDPANGLEAMHTMFEVVFKLVTTHFLNNLRVSVASSGTEASLTCSALAYHFKPGTGFDSDSPSYRSGGIYHIDVIRDEKDNLWKIKKWLINLSWLQGDASVMQG